MANLIGIKTTGDILTAAEINAITQMLTAPTAPTIAYSGGQTGTLALVAATVRTRTPDQATYALEYNWTPTAVTTAWTQFFMTGPALWGIAHLTVNSTTNTVDGLARFAGLATPVSFNVRNETTATQRIVIFVTLVKD